MERVEIPLGYPLAAVMAPGPLPKRQEERKPDRRRAALLPAASQQKWFVNYPHQVWLNCSQGSGAFLYQEVVSGEGRSFKLGKFGLDFDIQESQNLDRFPPGKAQGT